MKRIWLDYVRNIYAEKTGGVPTEGAAENEINTNPDGFPLFPDGIDVDQLSKREAEKLARTYLRKHYCENDFIEMVFVADQAQH